MRQIHAVFQRLVVLAIIGLCGCASVQPGPKPDESTSEIGQQQRPEPTSSLTPQVNPGGADDGKPERDVADAGGLRRFLLERTVDPMTWFTLALLIVSYQQWRVMGRQADMTMPAPKVIIRELDSPQCHALFEATKRADTTDQALMTEFGFERSDLSKITGGFRLTNKGGSEAKITSLEGTMYIGAGLPPQNPCHEKPIPFNPDPIPPGYTDRLQLHPAVVNARDIGQIRTGALKVYAIGKVVYKNKLGHFRRTGFARRFELTTGRFVGKDDQDYEYQD